MKQSEIDAYDTKKLVKAFREMKIEISEKQLEDLRELFDMTMGIPCRIEVNSCGNTSMLTSTQNIMRRII